MNLPKLKIANLQRERVTKVCLLVLLGLVMSFFTIKEVYANPGTFPSDGDAWTENDNATYPWTVHPVHANNTVNWTTENKVGTYAVNFTHTDTESSMAAFLEVNSSNLLNVTPYDVLVFWVRLTKSSWSGSFFVMLASDRTSYWYNYDRFRFEIYMPKEGEWFKVALPVKAFIDSSYVLGDELEPYTFKYLYFEMTGLSSEDNAEILLDGVHFSNFDYYSAINTLDYKMLPNLMAMILSETKTVVYNGTSYLSAHSMRALNGSYKFETLEMETIAQLLYAGSLIYNKTNWTWLYEDYLDKWATWLLQAQYNNSSSIGDGAIFGFYNNVTEEFSDIAGGTYLGWQLAGLSAFYEINGSATIKNAIEKLRGFLIDQLWDSTNEWFDKDFKRSTNSITDQTSWAPMSQGALATGLGSYLRWVSSNSTVENVLYQLLSKGLTTATRNEFIIGAGAFFEDDMYVRHGLYQAYMATSNTTYYGEFLNTSNIVFAINHLSMNGSMYQSLQFYGEGQRDAHFDGWGTACALPLLVWQYDLNTDSNLLNLVEQILFDTYPNDLGTSDYGTHRLFGGGADDWANHQYMPANFFLVLGLLEYFDINPLTNPYVIATDVRAGITSHSWTNNRLTFTINASSGTTSTTKISTTNHTPIYILNASFNLTRDFNETSKLLDVSVNHSSNETITIGFKNETSDPLEGNSILALDDGIELISAPTYNSSTKQFNLTINGTGTNKKIALNISNTSTNYFKVYDNNQLVLEWRSSSGVNKVNSSYNLAYNSASKIATITIPTMSEHNISLDHNLKADGSSCSSSEECSNSYCVHSICRSSSTYCGDGYCDSGEDCSSCSQECVCSSGYYCYYGQCISYGMVYKGESQSCLTNTSCYSGLYCIDSICKNITVAPEEEVLECPICLECSDWSSCIDNEQTRTCYRCSEETNYTCEEYSETEYCEIEKEEVKPYIEYWHVWLIIVIMAIVMFWLFKIKLVKI